MCEAGDIKNTELPVACNLLPVINPRRDDFSKRVNVVRRDPKVLRRVSWILNKEGLPFANLFYIFE
jgi:hypothetical protein